MDKARMIVDAREKMKRLVRGIAILSDLPALPHVDSGFISDVGGDIFLRMPYDLPKYRSTRHLLRLAGWKISHVFADTSDGERTTTLKKNGCKMILIMQPYHPKATCKRVIIGERATTQTLYEVRCTTHKEVADGIRPI